MSDWKVTDDDWGRQGPDAAPPARSILVVDDDASVRSMLTFLFEDAGYEVTAANDGSEALVVLGLRTPDVMVLDLIMPNVDGHGVLRERSARGLAPETRVIVLTAKSDTSDAVWCWEAGADEFMNKPVDPETLVREVELLLKRSAHEARHRREQGLAEARRFDAMEAAFDGRRRRR